MDWAGLMMPYALATTASVPPQRGARSAREAAFSAPVVPRWSLAEHWHRAVISVRSQDMKGSGDGHPQVSIALGGRAVAARLPALGLIVPYCPGPAGAVQRPWRSPMWIGFRWRFCMGARGA